MKVVSVRQPSLRDCAPKETVSVDDTKYQLNRENFSLIISSVEAETDSDMYECQLNLLDPASPSGATISFNPIAVSLIVDGKLFIFARAAQ